MKNSGINSKYRFVVNFLLKLVLDQLLVEFEDYFLLWKEQNLWLSPTRTICSYGIPTAVYFFPVVIASLYLLIAHFGGTNQANRNSYQTVELPYTANSGIFQIFAKYISCKYRQERILRSSEVRPPGRYLISFRIHYC